MKVAFLVPDEPPLLIISIACPAVNVFAPEGVAESTSPAADPELAIVKVPPVTAAVSYTHLTLPTTPYV